MFEIAINNSVFRPIFRKEKIIDYHLVSCLIIAYNNCWFSNEELERLIRRVYIILKIAKDTLDSGAYSEFFKYLVEQCSPHLLDTFDGLNMESKNPERTIGWEDLSSTISKENISFDNLSDYYSCEVVGVNFSSISVWEELIGFELEHDSELTILYQTLEKNYFPGFELTKMSHCFHVITAVLISNVKTFPKATSFIMEHAGRLGLVNQIKAFALIGDDQSGRQYVEMLLKLCEALVYPSAEHKKNIELLNNQTDKIVNLVCNSKTGDWDVDCEKNIMYYLPDQRISVRWKQYEEYEPFDESWATKYPDKKAYSTQYYIYQEERIIKVFNMVWVDGYRALIPMPDITNKHIDRKSYRLACLVNDNIENLNRYIISSGLIVD